MKRYLVATLLTAALSMHQGASAQSQTSADYVCVLAGKCPEKAGHVGPSDRTARPKAGYQTQAFAMTQPVRANLSLNFASGSATMTREGMAEARAIATALKDNQLAGKRFRIEGHTDSVGSRAYNLDLSRRRAASVVRALVRLGVPRSRLEAQGFGFDRPVAGFPASADVNRRVEAVALP